MVQGIRATGNQQSMVQGRIFIYRVSKTLRTYLRLSRVLQGVAEVGDKISKLLLQYIEFKTEAFFGGGEQVFDGFLCAPTLRNKGFHLLYCGRWDMAKTILGGFVEVIPYV